MAIKLNVESYCHECAEFEPEVSKAAYEFPFGMVYDTSISCKHKDRCKAMYERIKLNYDNERKAQATLESKE